MGRDGGGFRARALLARLSAPCYNAVAIRELWNEIMTVLREDVEQLVPTRDGRPLLRGLLIGVAVGATVAGLIILGQTIQARRSRRQPPPGPASAPPPDGAPSPL
jgi:hypothetical protein